MSAEFSHATITITVVVRVFKGVVNFMGMKSKCQGLHNPIKDPYRIRNMEFFVLQCDGYAEIQSEYRFF